MTPDVSKWTWWPEANDRRCALIYQKHLGSGLSEQEEIELVVLQELTDAILNAVGPDLSIIAPVINALDKTQVKDTSDGR